MTENVTEHPHSELLREAQHERSIVDSPVAETLQQAIFDAVKAYAEFLERQGLISDPWTDEHMGDEADFSRLKASALVVIYVYGINPGTIDIMLKDGAVDRVYGTGTNPDSDGRGPPDIPHEHRASFPYDQLSGGGA
jgi:hypothetical protein